MTLTETEVLRLLLNSRVRVCAAAWIIVKDAHASEDIFQNVVLKAVTRDLRFETDSALLSWAFVTARREAIDWFRRRQRETSCPDAEILELLGHEWISQPPYPAGVRMEALQACLEAAPESGRHLLQLRYFEGFSCQEVAERMGLGLNAVYKRLSRLHASLKECIEKRLNTAPSDGRGSQALSP